MFQSVLHIIYLLHIPACWCMFSDISFHEVNERLAKLNPVYSTVKSALELYSIDQVHSGADSCSPIIARISHMSTLEEDLSRPQAFISGEIHGDERIGPSASLVTAEILVMASECVIEQKESTCSTLETTYDINDKRTLRWLAVLATRRDTYVIPTTNCMGHMHRQRAELGVDTNRDFPYGRSDNRCLRTTTAQVINSVMKNNLIQLVITFHGGMAAIGYEWGSLNHRKPKDDCPDSVVHSEVAQFMKTVAGGWSSAAKDSQPYPAGKMNSIVYPVDGGMEDWVYASGWDTSGSQNHVCDKFSYFHPHIKPLHSNEVVEFMDPKKPFTQSVGNRAVVFLVETSDMKNPSPATWGKESNLLSHRSGHVPRNIRLNLVGLDMLQPYLCVESVDLSTLQTRSEAESTSRRTEEGSKCSPRASTTSSATTDVKISWSVNGVANIDATWLSVLVNPLPPEASVNKFIKQNTYSKLQHYLNSEHGTKGVPQATQTESADIGSTHEIPLVQTLHSGDKGRWADNSVDFAEVKSFTHNAKIKPLIVGADCPSPALEGKDDSVIYLPAGVHWIVPYAAVDGAMGKGAQGYPQNEGPESSTPMPPQSHMSNVRNNNWWHHVLASGTVDATSGKVHGNKVREVVGFSYWAAEPIIIHVFNEPGGRGMGVELLSATLQCAWWEAENSGKSIPSSSKELWVDPIVELELKQVVDTDIASTFEKIAVDKPHLDAPPVEAPPAVVGDSGGMETGSWVSSLTTGFYFVSMLSLLALMRYLIKFLRLWPGSDTKKTTLSHQYEMVSVSDDMN